MIIVSNDGVKNKVKFINVASAKTLPLLTNQLKSALSLYGTKRGNSLFSQADNAFMEFVNFCYLQNKSVQSNKYIELNNFDVYFFKCFYDYLVANLDLNVATQRYKSFRKAIQDYQKENSHLITPLILPSIRTIKLDSNQPLSIATVNQLRIALESEVDKIYQRLQFVDEINQKGTEIHWHELKDLLNSDDFSINNLCYRYKYHYKEEKNIKLVCNFKKNILKCPDPKIASMHVSDFISNYHENGWSKLAEKGRMPRSEGMTTIQFKLVDVLVTLQQQFPDYPLNTDLNTLITKMSGFQSDYKKGLYNGTILGEIDNIFDALRYKVGGACKKRVNAKAPFIDSKIGTWEEILFQLHPSRQELLPIFLLIMIQSGWNKETVLSINLEDFTHALNDLANSDNILIKSSKARGQQKGKPYFETKVIYAISSKKDKYSAFNLLTLLKKITCELRNSFHFTNLEKGAFFSEAFICLKYESSWNNTGGIISSLSSKNVYSGAMVCFLNKHKIYENGFLFSKSSDFTARIRPTWQVYKKRLGVSSKIISILMGHESMETTDVHYDSSAIASFDRVKRLGHELNGIEADLKNGSFKGRLIQIREEKTTNSKFKIGHIFADYKQSDERLICLCHDSSNPTFKNHEYYVKSDEVCKFITKCLLCKQSVITRNSLPYIIDRLSFINDQESILPALSFEELYGDEKSAIEYVLHNWPSSEDIFEAEVFQMENHPLLPAMPNLT